MTRSEALAVLGLAEGVSGDEIRARIRRLIQRMHPDVGGSADLAAASSGQGRPARRLTLPAPALAWHLAPPWIVIGKSLSNH